MKKDRVAWSQNLKEVKVLILQYADDVTLLVEYENPTVLTRAANKTAENMEKNLSTMGLDLSRPESFNMVVSPGGMVGGIFRRSQCDTPATAEQIRRDDRTIALHVAGADQAG